MPWKNEPNIITILFSGLMALFGGVASYCYRVITKSTQFSIGTLLLQVVISGFAGSLMFLIATYYGWSAEMSGGLSGVAGWSGAKIIEAFETKVIDKVISDE